ncbi:uncharacterized protein M6B38_417565 [Iris pallida]|uniref:Uncharacterized protein n=1 Tax=Iris pallida TaxID=29817 RepID=A0AAX6FIT8_IRIPA|nr:uncharacterized protein M6B38_417565 [Iris pallida]
MQAHFEQIRVYDGAPAVPVSDSISDLPDDGLDPLFLVPAADEGLETLDVEEEAMKKTKKSVRKRLSMEEEEEVSKKKKKNKKRSSSKEPAREKKRMEKERQAHLEQIHAESQRLLRETRNASFKPVPLVQKPISSVLEKIRLRKLEVLKRSGVLVESDRLVNEIVEKCEPNESHTEVRDGDGDVVVEDHVSIQGVESGGQPLDPCGSIPCNNVRPSPMVSLAELNGASTSTDEREASVVELNVASHTSTNERETVAKSSKPTDENQLNDLEDSSDANLSTSNINLDPDNLSSEEDDDKENIAPQCPHISDTVNMDSSPSGGLAKLLLMMRLKRKMIATMI